MNTQATFAAGCFWGVEAKFRQLPGVKNTRVGYTGGHIENPDYKLVCSGQTGHAEAIEVEFDPAIISYVELLDFFWQIHNPTTLNRQGPDVGTQYRSAVFYHDAEQKQQAESRKTELNTKGQFSQPIVTEITAASTFYPAEEYHQCYLEKQGRGSGH
ncbi:MAG: peptide-methionine (S)-S-oxide reductase MsrA [Methylophaga sp.]